MAEPQVIATAPPKPPKGRSGWIWGVVILIFAGLGVFFFIHGKATPTEANAGSGGAKGQMGSGAPSGPGGAGGGAGGRGGRGGFGGPVVVAVATAHPGDIGVYVRGLGTVTPLATVAVRSRVEGQLVKIYYEEGQWVKQGDPIVEIDAAPYQAALSQAEGQLARDMASLENAKLDLKRYEDAFARNAIPRQQLDTQNSQVRQFEGALKLDQAQVENAKVQLAYCHIAAPISGRMGLRLVDPGNIVRSNDTNPLVVITEVKPIAVVFSVAEDYLPQVLKQTRAGNKLPVEAFDRAEVQHIASGVLQTIDNQVDVGTGSVRMKALFSNEDESLFPNQFVNAHLLVETHRGVTLVPNVAVQRGAKGPFVFAIKTSGTNGVAAAQSIQIGASNDNFTEAGGLEQGTKVAIDNFNRLSDGAKVIIRPTGGGTNGPPRGMGGGAGGGFRATNGPSRGPNGVRGSNGAPREATGPGDIQKGGS